MLRWYQSSGIDAVYEAWTQGHRKVLLHMATGGGKTVVFCEVIKRTVEKFNRAVMMVRGRQLVDQASKRLFREGVSHGVRMANHWNKNYGALAQVCSIDTLTARNDYPEAKLVVVDEAHLFTSPKCREVLEMYYQRGAYILAVTATPYTNEPLDHLAETIVHPVSVKRLIDEGFLVNARYYAPSTPDLKGVRTSKGDYNVAQLEERMSVLTGDVVSHWKALGQSRPTVCFAVNIHHSLSLVEQFKQAGVPAEHIEGEHSFREREAAIKRLQTGEIKVLCNVGVLCTGVDIPFLGCIIMARPTKSYNLFIQQAGRGTRPVYADDAPIDTIEQRLAALVKRDFIVLDHAGNVLRHGFITDEPDVDLEGRKSEGGDWIKPKKCEECYAIYVGSVCHVCGWMPARKEKEDGARTIEIEDGVLEELRDLPEAKKISIAKRRFEDIRRRRGYKWQWVYHRIREEFGDEAAKRLYPGKFEQDTEENDTPWFLRRAQPFG